MAYTRRVAKQDIRAIKFSSNMPANPITKQVNIIPNSGNTTSNHNPAREVVGIMLCSLPLVGMLFVANYFDRTQHWVVKLAERLMSLGN